MPAERFDLAVVGAGIVGLGAAAAAVERGLRVVVVDRAGSVTGASVRNFGHIGVGAHSGEAGDYALRSRELWMRLAAQAGCWIRESGALIVARHKDERDVLAESGIDPLLDTEEVSRLAPVTGAVAGALLPHDLQVDPREATPALAAYLATEGVHFLWHTSALGATGGILHTSRGEISAETIVFAVGHDLDHLFPQIAETHGVERCALDMMLADGVGLGMPLLTGTSMLRYSAFAEAPSIGAVRHRYESTNPAVFTHDVNQMYTERPDGTLLVGDTHTIASSVAPFQQEEAFTLLEQLSAELFGRPLRVRQRWQGVYAKGPKDFLRAAPGDGIRIATVTTGIGMTCGLGFAESVVGELWG